MRLLLAQIVILFCGTIFAWSKSFTQIGNFYYEYGTLLRFNDVAIPNPLTTACIYGSTAFLIALYWSVLLYQNSQHASALWLRNFLAFCVVFAGSVVAYEAIIYYRLFGQSTTTFICTPGVHPLQTPCFTGMLFFLGAFITSIFLVINIRHLETTV